MYNTQGYGRDWTKAGIRI